jgi:hypothetical protein
LDDLEKLLKHRKDPGSPDTLPPSVKPLEALDAFTDQRAEPEEFTLGSVLPERVEQMIKWPCFSSILASHHSISTAAGAYSPNSVVSTPHVAGTSSLDDMDPIRLNCLLDNFFTYVHCKNPILDEPVTRRLVRRAFLDDGIDWSAGSCLSLVIAALGCVSAPFGPTHDISPGKPAYSDSQVFFQASQRRIGTLLPTSDIVGAQCLFLSGVYCMTVLQPIFAWRYFSQALAACQHFPFLTRAQQQTRADAGFSAEEMQMGSRDTHEQAVYWSAWKSEQELRSELSLPDFGVSHAGSTLYPPFFPTPPSPQLSLSPGAVPEPHEERARKAWLFYLAEISLRRLNSRLCSEILTLRGTYSSTRAFLEVLCDMIPEYEAQARGWAASLPEVFSVHDTDAGDDDVCRSVLRCHLVNLFELIYWAATMACLDVPEERSASLPERTMEMGRRGLEAHVDRLRANEPGLMHRHHGTLFMIKCCTRSMLTLLAAHNRGLNMPPGWVEAVYKGLGMLEYWAPEVPELVSWRTIVQESLNKYGVY